MQASKSIRKFLALMAAFVLACALAVAAVPATARAATSSQTSRYAISALDTEYTIDVDDDGYVYVSFTPSTSGCYAIQTVGDDDTSGVLYDSELNELTERSSGGDDDNTWLVYYLEAGTTYYADLYYGDDDSANSTITVLASELEASILTDSVDVLETTTGGYAYYQFTPSETGIYEFTLSMTSAGSSYAQSYATCFPGGSTYYWVTVNTTTRKTSSEDNDFCIFEAGTSYIIVVEIEEEDHVAPSSLTLSVKQATITDISSGASDTFTVDGSENLYFSYTPTEDGIYEVALDCDITITSASHCRLGGYLYNSGYESLGYVGVYSSESGSFSSEDSVVLEAGKTYFLCFASYTVDETPLSCAVSISQMQVATLTLAQSVSGFFTEAEDEDYGGVEWITFTPTVSGSYTFTLTASDVGDMGFSIFDVSYELIGNRYYTSETVELEAGQTYYIRVALDYHGDSASYTLSVKGPITRLAGENRYETAAAVAEEVLSYTDSDYVIVASGADFPDALAASYAAGVLGCSVVLTKPGELPDATAEAIVSSGASHVIIVGGTSAVSEDVEDAIAALSGVEEVRRIAEANRYETAAAIYEEFSSSASGTAILATGQNYADALCASPLSYAAGWPILLTKSDTLPAATLAALADFDSVVIVGGTSAVSQEIEDELEAMGITVTRIAGDNRYETAVKIAEYAIGEGYLSAEVVGIATGTNYPDALVGGSLLGARGGVLLLAKEDSLSGQRNAATLAAFLDGCASEVDDLYVFGGESAVSESLEEELGELIG